MGIRIGIGSLKIGQGSTGVDWSSYCTPQDWDWELPIPIQRSAKSFRIDPSFSLETYADIAVSKTYYVSTTGNDANSGLTADQPLAKLSTALGKVDVDRVFIAAGWYDYSKNVHNITCARNVKIIGVGDVYLSSDVRYLAGAFSLVDNHYEGALVASVATVIDLTASDAYGDYKMLVKKTSSAEVDATAGTFYQTGGVLYIHNYDGRIPDANNKILYSAAGLGIVKDSLKFYFENLKLYFGGGAVLSNNSATGGLKVYAKDCNFFYNGGTGNDANGVWMKGVDEAIFENCNVAHNTGDGFNAIVLNTKENKHIEINCKGYDNGIISGTALNGSSVHNSARAVRINGEYHHNRGSNVMDINTSMSLNLGCNAHHSEPQGTPSETLRGNFVSGSKMWCEKCVSANSYRDYIATGEGAKLYKKDCAGNGNDAEVSGGDIQTY